MRLTVLGSGVGQPALRRGSPAHAVQAGEDLLYFDLGAGALRTSLAAGLDPRKARHFFFSHLHPDHTSDLVPFLFACRCYEAWRPAGNLHFYGPPGLARFLEDLEVPYRWLHPRGWERRVHEISEATVGGEGWTVTGFSVEHGPDPANAWRIRSTGSGRTLCYSGDSQACEGLVRAAFGADLFLCECTVPTGFPPLEGHMSAEEVGRVATRAGVGRVVLTHLSPASEDLDLVEQVGQAFVGPVERAEDGASWEL